MINSLWWMLLLLVGGLCALTWVHGARHRCFAAIADGGDEDIKIAPGSFSERQTSVDAGELAAQDFLRQKRSGNVEKARDLGSRYARALLEPENGPLAGELQGRKLLVKHHQYLLYSYVVSHVIADHSPNSILAQTSLNLFYSEVEGGSPELYRHISDMAAFSLYILYERSRSRSEDDEVGRVFAELCGAAGDAEMIDYGNCLYDKLYEYCIEEIRKTAYTEA